MYDPPAGYVDCEADAEHHIDCAPPPPSNYRELHVDDVGIVHARRPLPNAIPALAGAANAKITPNSRADYLNVFVQNHLQPGEFEDLLRRMLDPDSGLPADTLLRVSRAIATAGTARPTVPSSSSH